MDRDEFDVYLDALMCILYKNEKLDMIHTLWNIDWDELDMNIDTFDYENYDNYIYRNGGKHE